MILSPIVPAVIPQSFSDLETQVAKLSHVPEVHVDIVDGVFVPALSWPYTEPSGIPATAYSLLAPFSLEVDLMVEDQCGAASAWLQAGADQLVFHAEVISPRVLEQFITDHAVTVGIASNNNFPLSALYEYFPFVEYVQVMGIAEIGAQGQPFDTRVLQRIAEIRQAYPTMPISIDGSINETTIPLLKPFLLSRYIVGSAIIGTADPLRSHQELSELVGR